MAERNASSERGREALHRTARTALLINGIAAFMLLVFLAHLYGLGQVKKVAVSDFMMDIADALWVLLVGMVLVAVHKLADCAAVLMEDRGTAARRLHSWLALLFITASYACFAYAAYVTHAAFLTYLPIS